MSEKFLFVIPNEIKIALRKVSRANDVPISRLILRAVVEYLQRAGENVMLPESNWGGSRRAGQSPNSPESSHVKESIHPHQTGQAITQDFDYEPFNPPA